MDLYSAETLFGLARTKFLRPSLTPDILMRSRLINPLSFTLLAHQLTLISSPAGSGKTTLLTSLLQTSPQLSQTWLFLDEEDNDACRFLAALVGALQSLSSECGKLTLQRLLVESPTAISQLRQTVAVMINEIIQTLPDPFVMVLDDLQVVTKPLVYQTLDYLLEPLPVQMHLVIATRYESPLTLARLRANRQVAELKLSDLRFTPQEIAGFLNTGLALNLSEAELAGKQLASPIASPPDILSHRKLLSTIGNCEKY